MIIHVENLNFTEQCNLYLEKKKKEQWHTFEQTNSMGVFALHGFRKFDKSGS